MKKIGIGLSLQPILIIKRHKMNKIVAMVPARLGSKRIKNKNLRLLDGKPLVCYVIEKAKETSLFNEIYLNSEAEVFADIAKKLGIKFYKRKPELASNDATNDEFVYDFLKHVDCDILIQINPTSPLFTVEDIKNFVQVMIDNDYEALHAVREERIEAIFHGQPLNFNPFKKMPRSQDLEPILLHAGGLMGWKKSKYFGNMKKYNCATYGCDSKIGYFKLHGFSRIDIDNEEDFKLVEVALQYLNNRMHYTKKYYKPKKLCKNRKKK